MKKVVMALFAILAFASCKKETPESQQGQRDLIPQGTEMQLDLSADLNKEDASLRSLDHKFVGNTFVAQLTAGAKVPVHTYIFNGNDQVYAQTLQWVVKEDGKTLFCREKITLGKAIDPNKRTILKAYIVDGTKTSDGIEIPAHDLSKVKLYDENASFNINVPYQMFSLLQIGRGGSLHNLELPKVTKQFLPMGTLVRVRLRNELNQPVTVSKIQTIGLEWIPITSTKLQAGWGLKFDAERQKRSQLNETTPREYVIEGGPISLSPGQTYSKVLLFWSNPLTGGGDDAQINIMPNEAVATPYYTSTGTYYNTDYVLQEEGGKVYGTQSALRIRDGLLRRVTLKLCPFPDPLSLLSEYALNSNGSDFLHDANDPAVGYFNGRDLISTLPTGRAPKTYPSGNGAKWHVPTWNEMSAIFPFEAYLDPRGGAGLSGPYNHTQRVRVGNYYAVVANSYAPYDGGKEIYSLTFGSLKETAYVRTKPDGSIESNLVGGAAMELRDDKRYAYYAKYDDAKQVFVVKSKYVGVNPTIKNAEDVKAKIDWTTPGLTTRTIPMYGWKESATSSPKVGQHTVKFLVNDTSPNNSVEPEDIEGPTPMVKYEIQDFMIVPMGKYTGRALTGPLGFGWIPISSTGRYPVFLVKSF
ncbi:hypothetical protein [Porphyromonas catoniae]|uniref:hypothetical protein n=1 Tax=Porphyromonas catoniae TaxID=41976 RepID=UPI0028D55146|nr:hypothetical protein [Porphyromonas catoniae]